MDTTHQSFTKGNWSHFSHTARDRVSSDHSLPALAVLPILYCILWQISNQLFPALRVILLPAKQLQVSMHIVCHFFQQVSIQ